MRALCTTVFAFACSSVAARTATAQTSTDDRALTEAARLAAEYPQDYALAMRLAWLELHADDPHAALGDYSRALALSDGSSAEARVGMAQANAAMPRPVRVWGSMTLGVVDYVNHPTLLMGWTVAPSLTLQFADALVLGATYRGFGYQVANAPPSAPPAQAMALPPVPPSNARWQDEVLANVGIARPGYALRLHGGYVYDTANPWVPAWLLGASTWLPLCGDLTFEASATHYQDLTAFRVAGLWGLSLTHGFTLGPMASAQSVGGALGYSLGGRAEYRAAGWDLALTVSVGNERRPTYLTDAVVYPADDAIRATIGLTARAPLGSGFTLTGGYQWQRLTVADTSVATTADAHTLWIGLEVAR